MGMKIAQLYEKYQIMPQLITHQLRVGAIGKMVAKNWKSKVDVELTTQLCLLHDMGNIVKFDLAHTKEEVYGMIKDIEYWQQVQKEVWEKYGNNAHEATIGILRAAKLDKFVSYINEEEKLYFAEAGENELKQANIESIILMYADCRVKPQGVVSYRERIDDLKTRYGGGKTKTWYKWTYWFDEWMQQQVQINLEEITEEAVNPQFEELLGYNIEI